jgi:hypothetical protein
MQQSNTIVEFRQQVYSNAFTRARDAQFEIIDALLLSPVIRSYPELSLSPAFRRQWGQPLQSCGTGSPGYAVAGNISRSTGTRGRPRNPTLRCDSVALSTKLAR